MAIKRTVDLSSNRFDAWIERHGMSNAAVARALDCDPRTVARWRKEPPPRYVLMACAAHSYGLPDLP